MNVKNYARALLCLCLVNLLPAHHVAAQILQAGDRIPPELWDRPLQVVNHPEGKESITLKDYSDKLILLDFWATWCAPCIRSLNKLDSLQKEFGNRLVIVPVTYENTDRVLPLFKKRGWSLPTVVSDTLIRSYFPPSAIPYQVWIRNGRFFGESATPQYVNSVNLQRALNGEDFILAPAEKPLAFDYKSPLFYDGNGGTLDQARLRSVFSKRMKANVGGTRIGKNSILVYNASFSSLVYEMYNDRIPYWGADSRMIWEVPDSLKRELLGTGRQITGFHEKDKDYFKWLEEYTYCYELKVDSSLIKSRNDLLEFMRDDLNRYWRLEMGLETSLERRSVKCYAIIPLSSLPQPAPETVSSDDYFVLNNKRVKRLEDYLSYLLRRHPYPVIDKTPAGSLVSVKLKKGDLPVDEIKAALNTAGFDLVMQEHKIDVIVIKNVTPSKYP